MHYSQIQTIFTSALNASRIADIDIEFAEKPTTMIIHTVARFWLFRRGKGKMVINGIEYVVKENTLVAVMPWDITEITEVTETLEFYKLVYNNPFINTQLRTIYNPTCSEIDIFDEIGKSPVIELKGCYLSQVEHCFRLFKAELKNGRAYENKKEWELSNSYISSLIVQILVIFKRNIDNVVTIVSENEELNNINEILRYIYFHLSEKITLGKLSSVFYMSESTIRRQFENNIGYSFSELIQAMRISKATDLLMYTSLTLEQISELSGFTDASHLTKVFNETKHATPNAFREVIQNGPNYLKQKEREIGFRVLDYIAQHSEDSRLSPLIVCQEFDISFNELNRITQFYVEKTFTDYLDWLRISKASELLLTKNETVMDVALEVGYNSTKTFQRAFYKIRKLTPTDFRKAVMYQSGT